MDDWRPTPALRRVVSLLVLLLIGAVATGRPDLVALALPLALGTGWALRRRPERPPRVTLTAAEDQLAEGEELAVEASVMNPADQDFTPVTIEVAASRWLPLRRADGADVRRPLVVALPAGQVADVALRAEALRWGRRRLGPARALFHACDALLATDHVLSGRTEIRVHPVVDAFEADDAMPRAAGLTGTHRSQRAGEGGELVGVRQFAPGDRLRRVDWRVSLRTRQLHVAATLSDRDAEVALLLDTLHEAGASGGVHGAASALDTTVRGAAAVAEHYLRRGDRVSLLEFGARNRHLRAASGRWQRQAVREWLLDTRAASTELDLSRWLARPGRLPANALTVVFTPVLAERSAALLAQLARSGRFLIAIDTLPGQARPELVSDWLEPAIRLWRLERQNTVDELREHGVPVVRWRGSGSLDEVLRDVARMALSARVAPR
ncbi:MAG: DUF58 domain-containing protein [Micromonosporaceae bacterium]